MATRPSQPDQSELSRDVAHAMNLFAHPVAGWAAASAVGMGFATQMWGLWAGAVAGMMENSARLGSDAVHAGEKAETVAAVKARASAVSLMAEAQSLAREVAGDVPAAPPARAKQPAKRAAPARRAAAPAPKPASGDASGRPAAIDRPKRPDDLKLLPGVGPKLEQVLNGLGIWTFGQVAGWSDRDVAWVEDQLGLSGRIARDGWVDKASELARSRRR